jgi:hypothetical protein
MFVNVRVSPPSKRISCLLISLERSLARNMITSARSWGILVQPSGTISSRFRAVSGFQYPASLNGGHTSAGGTVLLRRWCDANFIVSTRDSMFMAALPTLYATPCGMGCCPVIEPRLGDAAGRSAINHLLCENLGVQEGSSQIHGGLRVPLFQRHFHHSIAVRGQDCGLFDEDPAAAEFPLDKVGSVVNLFVTGGVRTDANRSSPRV